VASVTLDNVSKFYGDVRATHDLSFHCEDGQMLALLGPSGCGKTSTLKMIAGIEEVDSGEIHIGTQLVNDLSPGQRNIAMVFEDYALYPNMSVFENIAFPLKLRKWPGQEIRKRIEPVLELLGLEDQRESDVRRLSGGAQQRVSIGRALVREPELIIFDEPLSHLDADQKVQLRTEIRRLQKDTGLTGILVTHDQTEATAMADLVVIMNHGKLQQIASPQSLYDHPANLFVAEFMGEPAMNLLSVRLEIDGSNCHLVGAGWSVTPDRAVADRIVSSAQGRELILGVRPELIKISTSSAVRGNIEGTLAWREYRGDVHVLTIAVAGGDSEIVVESRQRLDLDTGAALGLEITAEALNVFDATSGRNLLTDTTEH
jgi:ABC-type sugar transport system ATPase subunit